MAGKRITARDVTAYLIFLLSWTGLMFTASALDLSISRAVFNPDAGWALWIQSYGTIPGMAIWGAAVIFLLACIPPHSRCRGWPSMQKASIATMLMGPLQPIFITSAIKAYVGRPRFVQLKGDFSLFTHFYHFDQSLSGVSFPSGHVATAVLLFPAAFVMWREGKSRAAATMFSLIAAWGVFTAAARIVAGAHYLTDTLFSFGLALALSPPVSLASTALWRVVFRTPRFNPDGSDHTNPPPA